MKRIFEIEFPELGEMWMHQDNLMLCINAYCENRDGKIKATDVTGKVAYLSKDQSSLPVGIVCDNYTAIQMFKGDSTGVWRKVRLDEYNQQKDWEREQEFYASELAKAEANIKAQEESEMARTMAEPKLTGTEKVIYKVFELTGKYISDKEATELCRLFKPNVKLADIKHPDDCPDCMTLADIEMQQNKVAESKAGGKRW